MARTITFQPSEELGQFIENLIASGGYHNQSEVVRAGLRLLQEHTANSTLAQLRRLIAEGEQSGEPANWDVDNFLSRMKQPVDAN
ncbi:type II toxin-antitoxin system ParD family antitoxin [Rheinheimera oceanensis]|uniref:type II toxin-antitoxin system ParD family antitoxin n=1 Tax=Rheinheimera oceanensis TaxID=2817449 RepID=UPI001BFE06F2|nr:type II toxin-antitoxin system ParD family antitoxin [Rheinheimera oceanensis]